METTVNFSDIIKKNFMNSEIVNLVTIGDVIVSLAATLILGMFIFYMYKKAFQGVLYTQSFNVSLVMIALVTNVVILTVSSNFILSLGMVGALSIVRFRTAIKDSMDIVFMFWAISVGIANGAGMFKISYTSSIIIALTLLILTKYRTTSSPYMLIVNYDNDYDGQLIKKIKHHVGNFNVKSKTVTNTNTELTLEVRIKSGESSFLNQMAESDKVKNVVLVSYNGDYVS
jgi:uncharacterized membrane protein YhiD involved in acid resistance